jgi:hypothetical protein
VSPFPADLVGFTECNAVKSVKRGAKEVETILQRLDRLKQDEVLTTAAQTLEVVHGLVHNMKVAMDSEQALLSCN